MFGGRTQQAATRLAEISWHDSVEYAALVVQRSAAFALASLARTEAAEVLDSNRYNVVEELQRAKMSSGRSSKAAYLHDNAANRPGVDRYIKEDARGRPHAGTSHPAAVFQAESIRLFLGFLHRSLYRFVQLDLRGQTRESIV